MISQLMPNEWQQWREIRLEALQVDPVAFTGSYETEYVRTEHIHREELTKNQIYAWRDENGIIGGTLGFYVVLNPKLLHRGHLFAMYVRASYRRRGIAAQLMDTVIAHAATCVTQVHLGVDSERPAALALYKKYGFEMYGTDPNSLYVDGRYYHEHLMVKML